MTDNATYCSNHLAYLRGRLSRVHKQQWIVHNYGNLLRSRENARVLEIGPGFGELLEILARDFRMRSVRAIDISEEVVRLCNGILPGSTTKIDDPVDHLEDHKDAYDIIFMLQVLEHIPKDRVMDLLRALRGALASGGMAVIEVPNMSNALIGSHMHYSDWTHDCGFTEVSLHHVLAEAGFSRISISGLKVPPSSLGRMIQGGLVKLLDGMMSMAFRVYGPSRRVLLSPVIFAIVGENQGLPKT